MKPEGCSQGESRPEGVRVTGERFTQPGWVKVTGPAASLKQHVTSSFQIQTRLSYFNSNMFPWLLSVSHVHIKSPNSFLALKGKLGQDSSLWSKTAQTEPNWLLLMNSLWIINQLLLLVIPLFISTLPLKLDHRRSLGKLGTESTCLIKNLSVENLMG